MEKSCVGVNDGTSALEDAGDSDEWGSRIIVW